MVLNDGMTRGFPLKETTRKDKAWFVGVIPSFPEHGKKGASKLGSTWFGNRLVTLWVKEKSSPL